MTPPPASVTSPSSAGGSWLALSPATARKLAVQFVFLATGVFSTCAAQYAFYEGAGDQRAMLLPLCNYLGMMLSGLVPVGAAAAAASSSANSSKKEKELVPSPTDDEPERTGCDVEAEAESAADASRSGWEPRELLTIVPDATELTRRQTSEATHVDDDADQQETEGKDEDKAPVATSSSLVGRAANMWRAQSAVQSCVLVSVVLDFAGCIFSNLGLSMAGSGLFQVVYSSVICWSALMSRLVLKKLVSREQWVGIALVTFGLAFSALGESAGGRKWGQHSVSLVLSLSGANAISDDDGARQATTHWCSWAASTRSWAPPSTAATTVRPPLPPPSLVVYSLN